MTPFPPPKLRYKLAVVDIQKERQAKVALWRACLMVSCVLGLGLLTASSFWKIEDRSQVQIRGNQLVGQQKINDALDIKYPQLIWSVGVKNLTQKVESIPSIEIANINRQIIPPKIIVSLQEREPKAIATSKGKMGFLDADGEWVAQEFYTNLDRSFN